VIEGPLSDVLALLKPRSYASGGIDAGADTAIRFGPHRGIKCYAVVSGQCWLAVEGAPEAVCLKTGDCFVLPRGWSFRLTTDLALPPVDAYSLFAPVRDGRINTFNGGGSFLIVGGFFALSGNHAGVLLGALPPIVHIRKESDKAALRWSIERMMQELRERQPGGFLIAQQLAYSMLIQALRLHLAEGLQGGGGLVVRPGGQTDRGRDQCHARGSGAALDPAGVGGTGRYVALDLRAAVQADRRRVAHGILDALAHVVGRRPIRELQGSGWGDRLGTRVRIRECLQHGLQESDGMFATAVRPGTQSNLANVTITSRWRRAGACGAVIARCTLRLARSDVDIP
jgi:Cupin